eukprot:3814195-Lingulodinium_polyedra.AAC.1
MAGLPEEGGGDPSRPSAGRRRGRRDPWPREARVLAKPLDSAGAALLHGLAGPAARAARGGTSGRETAPEAQ